MHMPGLKILLGNCYDHICTGHTVTLFLHAVAITFTVGLRLSESPLSEPSVIRTPFQTLKSQYMV